MPGRGYMKTRQIILAGIVIIALLSCMGTVVGLEDRSATSHPADTSAPDNGTIGPGSPLFGLKVAIENLDETFTFNDTVRVEKQVAHAQARITEVRRELERNQSGYAEQSLELYLQKLNQTEASLPRFPSNATGLLHAQEVIAQHQTILADLLSRYPKSTGLARAYNNNRELGQKFGEKTRMRFDRVVEKNNTTTLKAVKLETGKPDNAGEDNATSAGSTGQGRNETHVKDKKNDSAVTPTVATVRPTPDDDKGSSKDQGKKGRS
jgi:hypothetical protein